MSVTEAVAAYGSIDRWIAVKSLIIRLCAMFSRIPYLGKGTTVAAKKSAAQPL